MNLPTLEDRFVALIRDHKKLIYKACHSYTTTKDDFKDLEQEIICNAEMRVLLSSILP